MKRYPYSLLYIKWGIARVGADTMIPSIFERLQETSRMTLRGRIKNGVAVLDEPLDLPDGTPVRIEVEPIDADFWRGRSVEEQAREQGVEPVKNLEDLAGDWPEDASVDDFLARIRRSRV